MFAGPKGIPPLIEQQLLALDKQLRDAAFVRGAGRLVLGVCVALGGGLLLDGWLGLNGTLRGCLLVGWFAVASGLVWRGLIRPAIQPVSFSALAALVEQQFPELRERLTSLVELRGGEGTELAPGASTLMQDLLARQTVKAFDQLTVDPVASTSGPIQAVLAGAISVLLLLAPFAWNADGYGLLWSRFFVPWGNYAWGATLDLKVLEGDQVVARGTDVPVHVAMTERRSHRHVNWKKVPPLWLKWRDISDATDNRRLEWDDETQTFTTTLPHVLQSVTFEVTTSGAKTGTHRIDVADPPVITQFKLEIEPAAYTGLPAKSLTGVPGEVRVSEFSRIQLHVEFSEPVVGGELMWPVESQERPPSAIRPDQRIVVEQSIPLELSADGRSGMVNATASLTGPFMVRAKNPLGLWNNEPSRTLDVALDQSPQIKLSGPDEPVLVRPDDVFEQSIEVHDDFGLTAVELHVETSTGIKQVDRVSADERRSPHVSHKFAIDLGPFALSGGQVVTYRIRAVDNCPQPNPHEVWTTPRTLMINTSLKQLPDQLLAAEEKGLEDEISSLRTELNDAKEDLAELHQQTEEESLERQPATDKSERLIELQQAQDRLIERLQQLSDRFAERRMTQDLAPLAQRIAEVDLQIAQKRLEQAKEQAPRDQLEPIAQSIDHLGAADRQLQQMERQLNDLNKLEQDLVELTRMAQRAERLADQLEKLEAEQRAAADQEVRPLETPVAENSKQPSRSQDGLAAATEKNSPDKSPKAAAPLQSRSPDPEKKDDALEGDRDKTGVPQHLKNEGQKLADQMNELLKKHPELMDAARREQLDQLNSLADQARQLAKPQERLARALEQAAENAPAVASRPENGVPPSADPAQKPDEGAKSALTQKPDERNSFPNESQSSTDSPDQPKSDQPKSDQPKSDQPKSDQPKSEQPKSDQPKFEQPKFEQPKSEQPKSEQPKSEQPKSDQPKSDQPKSDQPKSDQHPSKENPTSDNSNKQEATRPANNPSTDGKPSAEVQSQRTESPAGDPSQKNSPQRDEKSDTQQTPQQQGSAAARMQEQIAREATQQALDLARETGADSSATKAAAEFARQADAAKQLAQSGQLATAAKAAREAEKASQEITRQLNPDGQSSSPQSKQAQQLSNQQRKAAQQLEQLAPSSEASRGAQLQGQRQLAHATNKLAEQIERAAKSLKSAPINASREGESGERAKRATEQAEQAMKLAEQANRQNDAQQSAREAANAAQKLKQAASEVQPSPPRSPNSPPVPQKVGAQVAEATKRIEAAQQQLSQCNCPKPGPGQGGSKPGSGSSSANGTPQSNPQGQSQSLISQQDGKPHGQNEQGTKPQGQPQPGGKPPGQSQHDGNSPGQNEQSTKPQGRNEKNAGQSGQPNGAPQDSEPQDSEPQDGEPQDGGAVGPQRQLRKNSQRAQSQLAQTADQFREAAAMLRQARGEPKDNLPPGPSMKSPRPGKPMPGDPIAKSDPGDAGGDASGTTAIPDLSHLDTELQQQARHNWGRLPGQLRTEILQGAGKKSHPEYTQRIKSYFDEITKPAR